MMVLAQGRGSGQTYPGPFSRTSHTICNRRGRDAVLDSPMNGGTGRMAELLDLVTVLAIAAVFIAELFFPPQ